jgi:hypothetical protein
MRAIILTLAATLSLGVVFSQDNWKDKYVLTPNIDNNRIVSEVPFSKYILEDYEGTWIAYAASFDYTKGVDKAINDMMSELDVILKSQNYSYEVDVDVLRQFCEAEKSSTITYDAHYSKIGEFFLLCIYVNMKGKLVFYLEGKIK